KVLEHIAYFFAHESCGKCYPCQMGTQRQLELLRRAAEGRAEPGDLERLMDIGRTMTDASICGLGQTAGMAVMSALRRWPELVQPVEKGSEDTSDGGAWEPPGLWGDAPGSLYHCQAGWRGGR